MSLLHRIHRSHPRRLALALAAAGLLLASFAVADRRGVGGTAVSIADPTFDPLLDGGAASVCGPIGGASMKVPAAWLHAVATVTKTETAPFQPQPMKAAGGDVPLYTGLGTLAVPITTRNARAQAYFNQGMRLSFAFNHAEAQRAFQVAQKADPNCAACFWGEALILGPNINVPMMPEANAPAVAALEKAVALKDRAGPKERALIEALQQRYSADPKAERPALDAAYADAMQKVVARYPADDTIRTLYAEAAMDTQPWDYWEPGGAKPKGRGAEIVSNLETVLKRNPKHAGAIHLYIHAVEASNTPERGLAPAERLGALMPAAGHVVHMPAHIYYRVGQYRRSLDTNKLAVKVDERYFERSPSDPMYRSAYYPHNIHFVMVSAQMGGDGATAIDAAKKLDAAVPAELAKQFQIMEPVKAAPFTTHLQFAEPDAVLALAKPDERSCWCGRCTTTPARSRWRARRMRRPRAPRPMRSPRSKRRPTSSRTTRGACRPRRSCRPRASSPPAASPTRPATSTARPRRTRTRSRSRTASATPSRRTGTTRCASRSAACGCARTGSTTPNARSAIRSRGCATTAGRSPALPRSTRRRATATARRRRSGRMRGRGSGRRAGRIWRGCERAAALAVQPAARYWSKGGSGFGTHSSPKISGSAYASIRA